MTTSPSTLRPSSRTRTALALVAVATVLVAACGGDSSSSRNRQLNSVLCFDTQEEKDAAIAEAQRALNEANPPKLEDASGVGSVAFIGPRLWWRNTPRTIAAPPTTVAPSTEESSTTTVAPTTTTITTSTTTTTEVARERTIGAPQNLSVTSASDRFVLSWGAPTEGGYSPERYAVLWQIDGGAFSHVSGTTSYEMPFTWFRAGATVTFSIRSDNDSERLYSAFSNAVTMQVPGGETATTTSSTVTSSEESTESGGESTEESTEAEPPLVGDAVIQQLQAALDAATNAPLCSDLEASSDTTLADEISVEPEASCESLAGFAPEDPTIAYVIPCAEATQVSIDTGTINSAGSAVPNERYTLAVGDAEEFTFIVWIGDEPVTTGRVDRSCVDCSFNGTEEVTTQDEITETTDISGTEAECDAVAGYDLNARTAFVTPCEAATMVRITFDDANQNTSDTLTTGGGKVTAPIPAVDPEANFSFVVFVGSQEATSGSVTYPESPQTITNTISCPVQASLTEISGEPYGQPRAWLMQVDACDAALVGQTLYLNNGFRYGPQFSRSMAYGFPDLQRVVVRVTVGEQLIAELDVPVGQTLAGGGTYETTEFAPVTEQFFGEYLAEPDPATDSEEESGDESGETVTCSGTYESRQLSFDCAENFRVMVTVVDESGYASQYSGTNTSVFDVTQSSPRVVWAYLSTDSGTLLWPITILVDNINYGGDAVAGSVDGSGTFEFEVPVGDCCEEEDFGGGDEGEEPDYFEGALLPSVGEQELTMSLPNPYPFSEFWLELTYECSEQSVEALVIGPDGQPIAQFVDMEPYNILSEGMCGVFLSAPVDAENFEIFEFAVLLNAETDAPIDFYGTATLQGAGVVVDPDFTDEEQPEIDWDDWVEQQVTAPNHFEITIPEGGRWFEALAPTGQDKVDWSCGGACAPFVDPEISIHDANGDFINGGRSADEYGELSKSLRIFLPEGVYILTATTYDVDNPEFADPQAQDVFTLRFRTERRQVPTVVIDGSGEPQVLNPPAQEPEEVTETTTTTTTTTVPASTTTTTTTVPTRPEQEQIIEAVLEPVGVIVAQVDEPKIELQPPPPAYVLPVTELQRSSEPAASTTVEVEATTLPSVAIPAGITEIVCGSECLGALGEAADIEDGAIEIQVGSEVILVDEGMREVIIPLSPRARQIRVTVTPTDGGEPVVLERSVFVLSPSNVPLKPGPTFTSGARVTETSSGATGGRSPIPFVVAAIVVALGAAVVIRRRGVRPTA